MAGEVVRGQHIGESAAQRGRADLPSLLAAMQLLTEQMERRIASGTPEHIALRDMKAAMDAIGAAANRRLHRRG